MAFESKLNIETATRQWLRPRFRALGREWIGFQVAGLAGLASGLGLALMAAFAHRLSPLLVLVIFACGILTFLSLAMATKIVIGDEALIYYHHEIAVVAAVTLLLELLRAPVLPYLDLTVLGIGTVLAFGRVGCLLAGCCHGRPCVWGLRYGAAHVREGLPHGYSGVRLFPVQALESALVFGMVATGVALLRGATPGAIFAGYVTAYAVVRFGMELLRGDAPRPYWLGFSEAQWTSLALLCGIAAGDSRGVLPHSILHVVALAGVGLATMWLRLRRRPENDLGSARHLCELAMVLNSMPPQQDDPRIRVTSLGVAVSRGQLPAETGAADFYSFSRSGRPLSTREANLLARTIANLTRQPSRRARLLRGERGVFHLVG